MNTGGTERTDSALGSVHDGINLSDVWNLRQQVIVTIANTLKSLWLASWPLKRTCLFCLMVQVQSLLFLNGARGHSDGLLKVALQYPSQ